MKYLLHLMQFTFKINKPTKRADEFENQKCIANSVYCRSVSVIASIWFIFFTILITFFMKYSESAWSFFQNIQRKCTDSLIGRDCIFGFCVKEFGLDENIRNCLILH